MEYTCTRMRHHTKSNEGATTAETRGEGEKKEGHLSQEEGVEDGVQRLLHSLDEEGETLLKRNRKPAEEVWCAGAAHTKAVGCLHAQDPLVCLALGVNHEGPPPGHGRNQRVLLAVGIRWQACAQVMISISHTL